MEVRGDFHRFGIGLAVNAVGSDELPRPVKIVEAIVRHRLADASRDQTGQSVTSRTSPQSFGVFTSPLPLRLESGPRAGLVINFGLSGEPDCYPTVAVRRPGALTCCVGPFIARPTRRTPTLASR